VLDVLADGYGGFELMKPGDIGGGMYLNDWKDGGFIDMVGDFEDIYITASEYAATESPYKNAEYWLEKKESMRKALEGEKWQGVEVLLASYGYENYSGDAFVLFQRDGKLFEVNGSHCSCYGLEGQWEPEETSKEALLQRLDAGYFGNDGCSGNQFAAELRAVLADL
jgi:hypothetical protein